MGNASMAEMADRLLGIRGGVEKSRRIGTSTWDGAKLSRGQVRYACVDAFLSRCLGEHIRRDMESDDEYESDPDDWTVRSRRTRSQMPSMAVTGVDGDGRTDSLRIHCKRDGRRGQEGSTSV